MTLSSGTRLGPYEILAPLGAGGMGKVYRARDERLKRDVAVKVLPASFWADADRLRRFEQETQAAGSLNHPNITAVYDIRTHEGAPYVVSEAARLRLPQSRRFSTDAWLQEPLFRRSPRARGDFALLRHEPAGFGELGPRGALDRLL